MSTRRKTPLPQTVDIQQLIDSYPKGSDELRRLRNMVWKKIAEPDIPTEAVADARQGFEKHGDEMFKRAVAKVKKERKEKDLAEE